MLNYIPNLEQFIKILEACSVAVTQQIFVYKGGFVGDAYLNKEEFPMAGGSCLNQCLRGMVKHAVETGFTLPGGTKTVAVIGPAYGAINYASVVSEYFEIISPLGITFIPTRTQLDKNDKHTIPEKLYPVYEKADILLLTDDIANDGTTIREVGTLVQKLFSKRIFAALCLADRGNNSPITLGIDHFYPFYSINMSKTDPRIDSSIFDSGLELNTILGKGAKWVEKFGYPPYKSSTDFSGFSLFKD